MEIPSDIVKQFFRACDQDYDDRISINELARYSEKHRLPFDLEIIKEMFEDATKGRSVTTEA